MLTLPHTSKSSFGFFMRSDYPLVQHLKVVFNLQESEKGTQEERISWQFNS